jgi:colicin import membrane protein
MTDATPYIVPKEPGRWRAITLAALVHGALLVFLWIGVHWQNDTPATIEAEVWSPQQREAAPTPEPQKEAEPQPVAKVPAPPAIEPPVEKPEPKADIALEQEKKRKAELEKKRLDEQRAAEEKKRREEKQLAELKEKKRQDEERDRLLKQQAEQKKLEKEKADKVALEKKQADEKKRKQDEAYNQMIAKMRDEDMRRITGVAGTGGSGNATKSQGGRVDSGYLARIGTIIKSNITTFTMPEGMDGNPAVEFEVKLLPDGSVAGIRKLKSSGIPGFDEAVARAIDKSQPYPKDKNGAVPPSFTSVQHPKDQ